jgi:hypothetical protein
MVPKLEMATVPDEARVVETVKGLFGRPLTGIYERRGIEP